MTTAPTPDGRLRTPTQRSSDAQTPPPPTSPTDPAQQSEASGAQPREDVELRQDVEFRPDTTRPYGISADLMEHPDAHTVAQAATVESLLRCWARETGAAAPGDGTLRVPLPASGALLLVPVHYWSPTGWHRFGLPYLADAHQPCPPLDAVTVAALLARESLGGVPPQRAPAGTLPGTPAPPAPTAASVGASFSAETTAPAPSAPAAAPTPPVTPASAAASIPSVTPAPPVLPTPGDSTDLVARVADSVRRTASFISERRLEPADILDRFLSAEQSLLLGHPLHPTPKSREGLTESEAQLYSPELRGAFPLHWIAVAPSLLAGDSAWTERGRVIPAPQLMARLAGVDLPLPDGYTALPLHPWQSREIRHRTDVAALLDKGLIRDLGTHGSPWHPTSSLRTVYRSHAPAMLKLSVGLHITNSLRQNLRKELHRGVEVHRLLRSGLSQQWQAAYPHFDIVRDPAWLGVDGSDGAPVAGLDVMIRHNPVKPSDDISCVAGLVGPRPRPPRPDTRPGAPGRPPRRTATMRSRLADLVMRLAARTGRPGGAVAAEWFLRYLEHVVRPVLWLDGEAGIALEAHQQNTLLVLDADGWPAGGRYRDNQGYYFRESRRAELDARFPGIGERSDTFVSDEVTDERFAYYLAINNVFGLIGAFGSQRLADETLLLAAFRRFLESAASGPEALRSSLLTRLLDAPVLRCKANLLTRLHGLDELIGPVDTQSVYVTIANPLRP
ncbi:IucA/IucC family protein [Streptomyces cadmiisoli]|uniref:IucA/IucC family protein n=1 Tax=Streptomyces cadmiisoli TaxID=2184053 RepID=UPI00365603E5